MCRELVPRIRSVSMELLRGVTNRRLCPHRLNRKGNRLTPTNHSGAGMLEQSDGILKSPWAASVSKQSPSTTGYNKIITIPVKFAGISIPHQSTHRSVGRLDQALNNCCFDRCVTAWL